MPEAIGGDDVALFGGPDLPDEARGRINSALGRVARWDVDDLLARDLEVLLDEAIDHFETATVLWDQVTMSEPTPLERGHVGSTLIAPVDGDPHLLTYRSHSGAPAFTTIQGDAAPGEVVFRWTGEAGASPESIASWFHQRRSQVEQFLPNNNRDVPALNAQMRETVGREIERRREAELARRKLKASLPFPISRQPGATRPVNVKRRVIRTERPSSPSSAPFVPEPSLEEGEYEHILADCVAMATVFERSDLRAMGEEQLRNLILGMLNTNFTGEVAGEVFNGNGKTDILIRVEDRNIFIGECKFYDGPRSVAKAIDQLLGYVVWRDSKAALLLFVKGGNFSEVVAKATEAVAKHPQCQHVQPSADTSRRSDFVFARADDPARSIRLALLPFRLSG
jgi:hypothetical protein